MNDEVAMESMITSPTMTELACILLEQGAISICKLSEIIPQIRKPVTCSRDGGKDGFGCAYMWRLESDPDYRSEGGSSVRFDCRPIRLPEALLQIQGTRNSPPEADSVFLILSL